MRNASYINYLLNIFEGKITITDIYTLPLALLKNLQKIKEKELDMKNKEMLKNQAKRQNQQMTVSGNGRRFVDKTTSN